MGEVREKVLFPLGPGFLSVKQRSANGACFSFFAASVARVRLSLVLWQEKVGCRRFIGGGELSVLVCLKCNHGRLRRVPLKVLCEWLYLDLIIPAETAEMTFR
jgi:hypothetical protein